MFTPSVKKSFFADNVSSEARVVQVEQMLQGDIVSTFPCFSQLCDLIKNITITKMF